MTIEQSQPIKEDTKMTTNKIESSYKAGLAYMNEAYYPNEPKSIFTMIDEKMEKVKPDID